MDFATAADTQRISNGLSASPKPIVPPNDTSPRVLIIGAGGSAWLPRGGTALEWGRDATSSIVEPLGPGLECHVEGVSSKPNPRYYIP